MLRCINASCKPVALVVSLLLCSCSSSGPIGQASSKVDPCRELLIANGTIQSISLALLDYVGQQIPKAETDKYSALAKHLEAVAGDANDGELKNLSEQYAKDVRAVGQGWASGSLPMAETQAVTYDATQVQQKCMYKSTG